MRSASLLPSGNRRRPEQVPRAGRANPWYVPLAVRGGRGFACALAVSTAFVGAGAAGCGGGERQDADEPSGTYKVEVIGATFPSRQAVAEQSEMSVSVRNADTRAVPNLAVTVNAFARSVQGTALADQERPVWILDHDPTNARSAYTNTWAMGALQPGEERTLTWRVTAIEPGVHTLRYVVGAGLNGKAKAQTPAGGVPEGSFTVQIADKPPKSRVDPETGKVIRSAPKQ